MARHLEEGSFTRRVTKGKKTCRGGKVGGGRSWGAAQQEELAAAAIRAAIQAGPDTAVVGNMCGPPLPTRQRRRLPAGPRAHHLCPLRHQRLRELLQHHSEHVQCSLAPALVLIGKVGQQKLQVLLQPLLACVGGKRSGGRGGG